MKTTLVDYVIFAEAEAELEEKESPYQGIRGMVIDDDGYHGAYLFGRWVVYADASGEKIFPLVAMREIMATILGGHEMLYLYRELRASGVPASRAYEKVKEER